MRFLAALVVVSGLVFGQAGVAHACACCADTAERVERTDPLGAFERSELEKLRPEKKASLFFTAAGFSGVSGITNPSLDYEMSLARTDTTWTLSFKDGNGKKGALTFKLPTTIDSFFVDLRDGNDLYKEWRLIAPVSGSGVFQIGNGAMIRLVVQGRGNGCTSIDQFTHWSIQVTSPTARFSLYGKLATP